jgi:uncharacterized Ntn-hydrolase superfamily protein
MMNKRRQTKDVVITILILGAFSALAILGSWADSLFTAVTQERSTYSIVAIDPVTGDVGAAGASCVPISASSLAALVPGKGAGAIQAAFIPQNQTKVFELLRQGMNANEIIKLMSDNTYDSLTSERQYGVVTLRAGNIQVAGFTGDGNEYWAGDRQDSAYAVSAQGNTLESEAVVSDALEAFSNRYWSS